jgi:NADH-quinone oxidoreductase subunit J
MNFTLYLFYIFSFVLVSSALLVVTSRNMVHSAMFLILSFVNASALFILLGAEFLSMLLIIVYVGAIAVLFLFVVMMLNVDDKIKEEVNRRRPVLILVGIILFAEILMILKFSTIKFYETKTQFPTPADISNTKALGNILYTDFVLPFQLAGGVLLVAMIGAIVLTMRDSERQIKKQNIFDQVNRNKNNSVELVRVKSGEGINL